MAKGKTYLILFLFVALICAAAFSFDRSLLLPAASVSIFAVIIVYVLFEKLVLICTGAKKDIEVMEKIALDGVAVYLISDKAPFAFALTPKKIIITTGLRNILNKEELEAIITRELFNITKGDTGLVLLFNLTSWKRDFEADAFAAKKTLDPDSLISAIIKINRRSFLFPPTEERIKLLKEI